MGVRGQTLWWAAGAVLALAACSGADGQASTSSNPPVAHGPPRLGKDPTRAAPAVPIPGARAGGTLRVLSDYGLSTLDPTEAYYTNTISIESGLLVRSLTQYVYDPASRAMILVPDLATDLGRPSHDFTRWEFTLRPGIRYENGRPVTAADLKFGIERSFDQTTFPEKAPFTNEYLLDGDTYRGPYRSSRDYVGVTVHGRTITVRMAKPFPDFPYYASFPAISPIPRGKASDPATYKNHPWATGPYMIDRYTPGVSMTLVRNPYWRADTDPGRHQYPATIHIDAIASTATIGSVLQADAGAGRTTLSMDPISRASYLQLDEADKSRLVFGDGSCTSVWFPDYRKITDIAVRRALAFAFPYRQSWADRGMVPGVTVLPASNLLAPAVVGRVPYNPLPEHQPGSTDAARARAILTESGHLRYPIRFAYRGDDTASTRDMRLITRALGAAGFAPHPIRTTAAHYGDDFLRNPRAPINVRSVGWCSDWPTGGSWLPALFESTDIATDGLGTNYGAFSEPAVDRRIAEVERLPLGQQPAAWNALDGLIQTRYFPVIVTGYNQVALMHGSGVQNLQVDSVNGMPDWKDLWVSE